MITSATTRIAAIGELLWDLLPSGPRLGGTITNFAVLSAHLGAQVVLLSRVGEDQFGRAAQDLLRHRSEAPSRLDLSCLQQSPDLPTGTVAISLRADGQPSYQILAPVAWDEIDFTAQLASLAPTVGVVCFGSLAQRNPVSRAAIRAFVEATAPSCVKVCDINLRSPFYDTETLRWCLAHTTLLKVSDEELPAVASMLGLEAPNEGEGDDPTAAFTRFARMLLDRAPQCHLIAITLGSSGSLLVDRIASHREPGRPVQVVDTIGAGDAFTAGMVFAYLRGGSLAQISVAGNLCGSFVASQPGATPALPASLKNAIDLALA